MIKFEAAYYKYMPNRFYFLVLFLLCLSKAVIGQSECVSGDCENGIGIYKWSDEERYEGNWKDGSFNGQGIFYYENGDKYVGNWKSGSRVGQGTLFFADGNLYMGEWEDDLQNGFGTFYFGEGDMYIGEWYDGKRDGVGTFIFGDGRCMKDASYVEDEIVGGSGTFYEICPDLDLSLIENGDSVNVLDVIRITSVDTGSFEAPLLINGISSILCVFDSYSDDLAISPDLAWILIRTGSISSRDFRQGTVYTFSDGSRVESSSINIRKIEIGNQAIRNVPAIIIDSLQNSVILGKNILSQLGNYRIDPESNALIIIKE